MDNSTRIWGNGCYDVFHYGHANFIRQAKLMGDYMIAGVHGDSDIAQNKAKPVMDEKERARMIAAVKWVDEVQEHIPYGDIISILEKHDCHYCVHGDDIARDKYGNDIYQAAKDTGRFLECKRTIGISTTEIIDRILLSTDISFAGGDSSRKGTNSKPMPMPIEYYMEKMREFSVPVRQVSSGDVVCYAQGVFDLFHPGHVDFLERCRKSAPNSYVVVGLLSDEEAKRVYGTYPITNVYERALALMSCRYVDKVVTDVNFQVTQEVLDSFQVDYVFHGKAWDCPEDPYKLPKSLNIFRTIDSNNEMTTEMIIERIVSCARLYYTRNTKKSDSAFSVVSPNPVSP